MHRWNRWLLTAALLVFLCALLAAAVRIPDDAAPPSAGEPGTATRERVPVERSTTTAPPSPFPAITDDSDVRAVRTPTGLLLPVVGGGPGAWEVRTPCSSTAVVADATPVAGAHVVLDPGHGGSEPGAVGPTGLTEKELNLDIARRAREQLARHGAVVELTRDRDLRMTLQTRGELARSLDPVAFVSIHHNASPVGSSPRPGSELYHQLADPESRRLAGLLWEELQEHLTPFGQDWGVGEHPGALARRSLRTGDDFYGVLRGAQGVPSVLSEAAYLSNPVEESLLRTDAFRDAEARAISDAVLRLVTTDAPGSGYLPPMESSASAGGGGGPAGCVDPPLG